MPKIVAGLMAIIALGGSILMEVDAVTTIIRGMVAFLVGMVATVLWSTFFGDQSSDGTQSSNSDKQSVAKDPEPEQSETAEAPAQLSSKPQEEKQAAA